MVELAKYLYCIIPCSEERTFSAMPIGAENGGGVHTLCHRGLAAVVSDSAATQYESSRRNMLAHEMVLETVLREFSMLPVRFGTVTDSASPLEDIGALLESRAKEFRALLGEMEGKAELGVKAFWRDEKRLYEEIVAENAAIRRLRNSLSRKPPEATHFERARLGRMVKEALEQKRANEAARVLPPLRRVAHRVRENAVLVDRVMVNAAFLVDRAREPEFDQVVSGLGEELGQRVVLKYVGPAPPYNFVNIVVKWKERKVP